MDFRGRQGRACLCRLIVTHRSRCQRLREDACGLTAVYRPYDSCAAAGPSGLGQSRPSLLEFNHVRVKVLNVVHLRGR